MLIRMMKLLIVSLTLTHSVSGWAHDFRKADALFAKRGQSRNYIKQAIQTYRSSLPHVKDRELVHAATRIAYLQAFDGYYMMPAARAAEKKAIFAECYEKTTELMNPAKVGKTPNYYHWKAFCLGLWGQLASSVERAFKVPLMKRLLADGLKQDRRYFGGGMDRIAAYLYTNPEARLVGLYRPQDALKHANLAIDSAAYPGDPNSGFEYYSNYRVKAQTLIQLGRKNEARALLDEIIGEINGLIASNDLPAGLEPETRFEHGLMKKLRARL